MKTIKKHTTSQGNELEFCTFDFLGPETLVVRDLSCLKERAYTIGTQNILSFDDYDKELKDITMITSFEQVINAWIKEEINF